jgi:hypothetical protein
VHGSRLHEQRGFGYMNNVRVTDAKEVGVGNAAEETYYHPNTNTIAQSSALVKLGCKFIRALDLVWYAPDISAAHSEVVKSAREDSLVTSLAPALL